MIDDSDILRRHFIAIATDTYEADGAFAALDVDREVASLREWLTDDGLGVRRFDAQEYAALAHRPSRALIEDKIRKHRRFNDGDAVVVYVTGHGITDTDDSHLIVLHDTDPQDPADALRTADLIKWLAAHKELAHAMIIIDVCQAGKLADNVPAKLTRDLPNGWFVMLTATVGVDAKLAAFSGAVSSFVDGLRHSVDAAARAEPYLEPYQLYQSVVNHLRHQHRQEPLVLKLPTQPSVCVPNPGYEPGGLEKAVVDPARRDLAVLQQDMAAHWAARSPVVAGTGPVFTGRTPVVQALIDAATGAPGTLVVSGRAGSGKSSVLARLVTCSDPGFRADHADVLAVATPVPPEGAVDIAVLATGKTSEQIAQQIGRALGIEPRPNATAAVEGWCDGIVAALAGRARPLTLVVDALDEASDAGVVVRSLLERLNPRGHPSLRLLLGVRSSGGGQSEERARDLASVTTDLLGATQLRIDADRWWDARDLRAYVAGILAEPGSPYGPAQIPVIAEAVEAAAGRSYLVAGLTARALAKAGEALVADDPRLQDVLAQGSAQLVAHDLRAGLPDAEDRRRAATLLRACALAEGRGAPVRGIWPLLASAIAPDTAYGDSDVTWLLGHRLSGYLVRDVEDGVTVYRPFHDELRWVLAAGTSLDGDDPADVVGQAEAQRRIALSLLPLATWGPG